MSEVWWLKLKCSHCGKKNPKEPEEDTPYNGVPYSPLEKEHFTCDYCGERNKIIIEFGTEKDE